MENAREVENINLHRQLIRELKNKNETLRLQHNKDKLLNDQLENYVIKLTTAYQREKSQVTVLTSCLRDVTNKYNAAVQRIYDLEHQRDDEREVELINADLTIEKQREVIEELESKLSSQRRKTEEDGHFCQNELEISHFKNLVRVLTCNLAEEREKRKQVEEDFNNLKSYIYVLKTHGRRQEVYGRQDSRVSDTSASSVNRIETSSKCTITENSNCNVETNDNKVEREHEKDLSKESKYTIYFEENSVYRPIGTSDSTWLTAEF